MRARFRWSVGLTAALLAATPVVVWLDTPTLAVGQPAKRPAGLNLIPAEGMAVVTVNVAALHDADVTRPVRDAFLKDPTLLKRLEADTGFGLPQIDRVTLFLPTSTYMLGESPMVVVTTRQPLDKPKVLKAWKATTEPNLFGGFCGAIGRPGLGFGGFGAMPNGMFRPPVIAVAPGGGPDVPIPPADQSEKQAKPVEKEKPLDLNAMLYYTKTDATVIIPIDDRTLVYLPNGTAGAPIQLLAGLLRRHADGPLAEALALADRHHLTAAVDGKHLRDTIKMWREMVTDVMIEEIGVDGNGNVVQPPPRPMKDPAAEDEFTPFEPLLQLDRGVLTLDVGPKTVARFVAHYPSAEAAKQAEPSAKDGMKAAIKFLAHEKTLVVETEESKALTPLFDFALTGLEKATVTAEGKTLTITATAEVAPALTAALVVLPQQVQDLADRVRTANNLKMIGLALHSYHDANSHFPQDVTDGDGKTLLSWRVQLLPYLEGNDLYEKIDKGRAWDDPVNKKLWGQMPDVFRVPGREAKEAGQTFFQAYRAVNWVGSNDCWLVDTRKVTMSDITDGLSNTVGVVEAEEPVNWMKPGDILFDTKKLPRIGNPKTGKANVVLLDGSTRTIDRKKYEGEKVIPLVTINGGEDVEFGR